MAVAQSLVTVLMRFLSGKSIRSKMHSTPVSGIIPMA